MKFLFTNDNPQQITEVTFAGKTYGITFIPHDPDANYDGEIGVYTMSNRHIKYMRLKWDYNSFAMRKSYIRTNRTPEDLYEFLITCAKLQTNMPGCIAFCEHVLKCGHCKR